MCKPIEIVYCEDCIHCEIYADECGRYLWCDFVGEVTEEDFCFWGEPRPKEDGEEI